MDITDFKKRKWNGGILFAYSDIDGSIDYKNGLTARTSFDKTGLDIKLPGKYRISFTENLTVINCVTGDYLRIKTDCRVIDCAFLDAYHILIKGCCSVTNQDKKIKFIKKNDLTLVGTAVKFNASLIDTNIEEAITLKARWLKSITAPNDISDLTRCTLCKMFSVIKTQVYTPERIIKHYWTTPDRWSHQKMWLLDSVFHAIGLRHINPELAREIISTVFDKQREDGFIAHALTPYETSNITQPPILAFGVKLVNEVSEDIE